MAQTQSANMPVMSCEISEIVVQALYDISGIQDEHDTAKEDAQERYAAELRAINTSFYRQVSEVIDNAIRAMGKLPPVTETPETAEPDRM